MNNVTLFLLPTFIISVSCIFIISLKYKRYKVKELINKCVATKVDNENEVKLCVQYVQDGIGKVGVLTKTDIYNEKISLLISEFIKDRAELLAWVNDEVTKSNLGDERDKYITMFNDGESKEYIQKQIKKRAEIIKYRAEFLAWLDVEVVKANLVDERYKYIIMFDNGKSKELIQKIIKLRAELLACINAEVVKANLVDEKDKYIAMFHDGYSKELIQKRIKERAEFIKNRAELLAWINVEVTKANLDIEKYKYMAMFYVRYDKEYIQKQIKERGILKLWLDTELNKVTISEANKKRLYDLFVQDKDRDYISKELSRLRQVEESRLQEPDVNLSNDKTGVQRYEPSIVKERKLQEPDINLSNDVTNLQPELYNNNIITLENEDTNKSETGVSPVIADKGATGALVIIPNKGRSELCIVGKEDVSSSISSIESEVKQSESISSIEPEVKQSESIVIQSDIHHSTGVNSNSEETILDVSKPKNIIEQAVVNNSSEETILKDSKPKNIIEPTEENGTEVITQSTGVNRGNESIEEKPVEQKGQEVYTYSAEKSFNDEQEETYFDTGLQFIGSDDFEYESSETYFDTGLQYFPPTEPENEFLSVEDGFITTEPKFNIPQNTDVISFDELEQEVLSHSSYIESFKNKIVMCNYNDDNGVYYDFLKLFYKSLNLAGIVVVDKLDCDTVTLVKRVNGVFYYKQSKIQRAELCSQFDIYFGRVLSKWLLQLIRNNKLFLGLTTFSIFNNNDLFVYYLSNKIRTGYKFGNSMKLANHVKYKANVTNLGWVTNMRKDKIPYLQLTKLYYGNEKAYPKFIGTDIISVRQYVDIPKDYRGKMGIAISTFLSKYNPEQFKILGIKRGLHTYRDDKTYNVLIVERVD